MNKIILVVDDDEMLRKTLAVGLRNSGFDVLTAESADSATNILNRVMVDAIVLDRMMVGTDGLTFLRDLRATGNATPVIMLTALGGAENAIAGLSGGANDYLAKPFQFQELVLRLNNIVRNRPSESGIMPDGLQLVDDEFYIVADGISRILPLSGEEKKLLRNLTAPMGNIVPAAPMVAKRLRNKLNIVLSNIDMLTVRGRGYKLITRAVSETKKEA